MRQACNFFILFLLGLFLSACGGGGSLEEGKTTSGGSTSTGQIKVELSISNTTVTKDTSAELSALVTKDGKAISGTVVTFTSTLGLLDPTAGTALTNAEGKATLKLTAGTKKGAGEVTAILSSGEKSIVGFTTAGDASSSRLSIQLIDTKGNVLNPSQISSTKPGRIKVEVNGINEPVIVTFSSNLGSIPITSAITNANNIAIVDIFASNSLGAGLITATLANGDKADMVFSIGASSLAIGTSVLPSNNQPDNKIEIPSGSISAGGTTTLSVTIWDTSVTPAVKFTDAVDVSFASACASLSIPIATIDKTVTTVNGVATSTYLAQGCEGEDIVTATANAGGIVLSATGTVSVTSASIGSIAFLSATPKNISLQGVGGQESSVLIFKVLDSNGNPIANKRVNFSLNTSVGGIVLNPANASTNAAGIVQTVVNSGTVHTSIRVTAEIADTSPIVRTQSSELVVSTGIPDQDSFSLSASVLNPEAWDHDGAKVIITARLADAYNNPVPDNTVVSFTTEGGAIEDSCVTVKSSCSVTWTSQSVRPSGQILGGSNVGPTVILGKVNILGGVDFSNDYDISFNVAVGSTPVNVILNKKYSTQAAVIKEVNKQLGSIDYDSLNIIKADAANGRYFDLVSVDQLTINVSDSSGYENVSDVLNFTNELSSVNVVNGLDLTSNKVKFSVRSNDHRDAVILDENYATKAALISAFNSQLTTSSVSVNSKAYLKFNAETKVIITGGTALGVTSEKRGTTDIVDGIDLRGNTVALKIETEDGCNVITLDDNYWTQAYLIEEITEQLVVNDSCVTGTDSYSKVSVTSVDFLKLNSKNYISLTDINLLTSLGLADGERSFSDANTSLPRNYNALRQTYGGRVTISATAIGEESFPDHNGNGVFDQSEEVAFLGKDLAGNPFDLAEAFVDHNEDGVYNPAQSGGETGGGLEEPEDFNNDGNFNIADGLYNGSLCGDSTICSSQKSLNVRDSLVLVMSGSNPRINRTYPLDGILSIIGEGSHGASVIISDLHNQPMPAGTQIIFTAGVGSIVGIGKYVVPNINYNGGLTYGVTIKGVKSSVLSGPLSVTIITPDDNGSGSVKTTFNLATIKLN